MVGMWQETTDVRQLIELLATCNIEVLMEHKTTDFIATT